MPPVPLQGRLCTVCDARNEPTTIERTLFIYSISLVYHLYHDISYVPLERLSCVPLASQGRDSLTRNSHPLIRDAIHAS